ncbi:MAG: flagellar type III secretion system pore protein FliP [Desulfobacterales bacterium]|nr:flagellar type III secretion system pore protein FliP [Desulfobacterales bacterium]
MNRPTWKYIRTPLRRVAALAALTALIVLTALPSQGAETAEGPFVSIQMDAADETGRTSVVMQIFLLMTVLSLAPAILIMLTSFTRIAIVLSVLRQAIGTQSMPPNQIIIGLALFLTFFIMTPVWQNVHQNALKPYLDKTISQREAFERAIEPVRAFMFKQTREKDLAMMIEVAKRPRPRAMADVDTSVLIPSFIISELKTAFQMAFMLYVPFLIIDMVVASVLLSMGMMMLPPVMVSLPFKLMLFVLADGWHLIVGSLVKGFA